MTPEKKVQNSIVDFFKELEKDGLPVKCFRREAGGFAYKKGLPDLYACVNGYHVEIEVKRKGGKLSTMQEKWRDKFISMNVRWFCFDNIDDCRKEILNILEGKK